MDVDTRIRRSPRQYDLFGLVAEASIDLPLPPAGTGKRVEIVTGTVEADGEVLYESAEPFVFRCYRRDDAVLLEWEETRFSVTRDRVVVDADENDAVSQLLVPAVWSVVLAAHHKESLHGSAVSRRGRAIAILGHSGSGKSTTAWRMVQRGWQLVSDDLLTFDTDLRVIPGPPWIRLLHGVNGDPERRFDAGGKVRMHSPTSGSPVALHAMVIMQPEYQHCVRLTGTSAVAALLQHLYNPVVTHEGQAKRRFELAHALATSVAIYVAPPRTLSPDHIEGIANGGIS